MGDYDAIYKRSLEDPEGFWGEAAAALHWEKPWDRVLDLDAKPVPRWFAGGQLNTCYNAVDRHVESGRGEQAALIYDSPVTDQKLQLSYAELRDQVANFAGALRAQGVGKGDRVLIYMPMIPEAAIAMLACAKIGAVHSVVFSGFSAGSLRDRLLDADSKLLITADGAYRRGKVVPLKQNADGALDRKSVV